MSKPKKCKTCGQVIKSKRSIDISDHFNAHVTQITRETGMDRKYVYWMTLLRAVDIVADGGAKPYPCTYCRGMALPERTSDCTNEQIMTAVEAAHMVGAEWGVYLTESGDE